MNPPGRIVPVIAILALLTTDNKFIKYFFRFLLLQATITYITIWYFDRYLIGEYVSGYDIIIRNSSEDCFIICPRLFTF